MLQQRTTTCGDSGPEEGYVSYDGIVVLDDCGFIGKTPGYLNYGGKLSITTTLPVKHPTAILQSLHCDSPNSLV